MRTVLRMIDEPDVWLVMACGLLAIVASSMTAGQFTVRRNAWRGAGGTFIAYFVYGCVWFRPADAEQFVGLLIRSVLAGWLAYGVCGVSLSAFKLVREATVEQWRAWYGRQRLRHWDVQPEAQRSLVVVEPKHVPDIAPVVPVVEPAAPPTFQERLREKIIRERERFDARVLAVIELQELGGFDQHMLEELGKRELERYIRRITDALAREEAD